MNKKGFTLIELLAVILILAIIAAIISPIVSKIIDSAKEQSDRRSAERYAAAAREYYVEAQLDQNQYDNLGINLIDKLDLDNDDATGYIVAFHDGTVEMALIIGNRCFTKTTTQDTKEIEVSTDISNCSVKSSNVRISSVNSMDSSVAITVDNSNNPSVTLSACKFGTSRNDLNTNGSVSGNTCTLSPTVSGTRYYYELEFSDGSKTNGSVQGGSGETNYSTGGGSYAGGGSSGGSGSGGSGSGGGTGVVAPVLTEANGRTIYTGNYLAAATPIYFDVTTGTKCKITNWSANTSSNSGCLKFYAYMEDNLSYTMILDRNTTNTVAWASSGSNAAGPVTAYEKLKTDTASWQGTVTPKDYLNVYMMNGSEKAYEINYDADGAHARFITTEELAHITRNNTFSSVSTNSNGWYYLDGSTSVSTGATWQTQIATSSEKSAYTWLYDYTKACTTYGCNVVSDNTYAYWTSDAIADSANLAWMVGAGGYVKAYTGYDFKGYNFDATTNVSNSNKFGIRPVVTILKSALQ